MAKNDRIIDYSIIRHKWKNKKPKGFLAMHRKPLAAILALVMFVVGCMAAYDLGAQHTCQVSGGVMLTNGVCLINESLDYCITGDGRFMKPDGRTDEHTFWNRALNNTEISLLYNSGSG